MHLVEAVLSLLVLVVVSNVISHYLVAVPVSLIQAALGALAALFFNMTIEMQTDWFMLLFVAPMLFHDGRRFPKRELWAMRGPIIGNAIFLVFATTFFGGLFIHWLVPAMPLAASLALAAILSPTDPIAVHSIANRVHLPKSVLHLVSGESLINDASGLIGFKYGIAATVTGSFVLQTAIGDFFYIAVVGVIAGAALMGLVNLGRLWLLQEGINDVILHTVIQIITPFLLYLVVDEVIHASGVIAVVVAGLMTNGRSNRYMAALPELRVVSERTWDILVYVLNGVIFLILGIELPVAMRATIAAKDVNTWQALLDVILVYLVVLAIRTLWVWGYMLVGRAKDPKVEAHFGTALLSGLTGVRGAITVVGVLAVPVVLADGTAFPQRQLMLFIAAGYVVLSLIAAVVFLPLFTKMRTPLTLRGSTVSDDSDETVAEAEKNVRLISERQAQRFMYQMAVRRIESERREANQKAALDLLAEYQVLLRRLDLAESNGKAEIPPLVKEELILRGVGLEGELLALDGLLSAGTITPKTYAKSKRHLERRQEDLELMLARDGKPTLHMLFTRVKWLFLRWWYPLMSRYSRGDSAYNEGLFVEKEIAKGGLKYLSAYLKQPEQRKQDFNRQVIYGLIVQYRHRIVSAKAPGTDKTSQYEAAMQQLRAVALAAERAAIHDLLEQGYVTQGLAQQLRQGVNNTENAAAMTTLEDV